VLTERKDKTGAAGHMRDPGVTPTREDDFIAPVPRLLVLETSGKLGQAAVGEGTAVKGSRRLERQRHARDLVPAIAELLADQGWKPADLDAVIVSKGPGSYTGLRVGIMAAKTFAFATGCKLLAVETFLAIACQAPSELSDLAVIADAQQGKVYVQQFSPSATSWEASSRLAIRSLGDWLSEPREERWLTGPGVSSYEARLPTGIRLVNEELRNPQADTLLRLGYERYAAGEKDDVWLVEPLYLRPSSAEEKHR
jgi:tRNA threonylcarbamoyladenosine biosynthesis protein TsaB